MIRLSVLDQSPISEGSNAQEALLNTVKLAQRTEKLGFYRFWVSEHHMTGLAHSSPEVFISHIAAKTLTIRVGSGGVMLPHYSAYKVAENFRLLEALYPGRIDLGLGRAPGGMPIATRALQEGKHTHLDQYPQQLDDLVHYLHDSPAQNHRFSGLKAMPSISTVPEVWLLGSSGESGKLAAAQGLSYSFAQFINGEGGAYAVKEYQNRFRPSVMGDQPQSIVSIFAVCADTDEEAEILASSIDLRFVQIEQGQFGEGTPSVENAMNYRYSSYERERILENRKRMLVGSPETVKKHILHLSEEYQTEEFMIATIVHDFEAKIRSYELLAKVFELQSQGG